MFPVAAAAAADLDGDPSSPTGVEVKLCPGIDVFTLPQRQVMSAVLAHGPPKIISLLADGTSENLSFFTVVYWEPSHATSALHCLPQQLPSIVASARYLIPTPTAVAPPLAAPATAAPPPPVAVVPQQQPQYPRAPQQQYLQSLFDSAPPIVPAPPQQLPRTVPNQQQINSKPSPNYSATIAAAAAIKNASAAAATTSAIHTKRPPWAELFAPMTKDDYDLALFDIEKNEGIVDHVPNAEEGKMPPTLNVNLVKIRAILDNRKNLLLRKIPLAYGVKQALFEVAEAVVRAFQGLPSEAAFDVVWFLPTQTAADSRALAVHCTSSVWVERVFRVMDGRQWNLDSTHSPCSVSFTVQQGRAELVVAGWHLANDGDASGETQPWVTGAASAKRRQNVPPGLSVPSPVKEPSQQLPESSKVANHIPSSRIPALSGEQLTKPVTASAAAAIGNSIAKKAQAPMPLLPFGASPANASSMERVLNQLATAQAANIVGAVPNAGADASSTSSLKPPNRQDSLQAVLRVAQLIHPADSPEGFMPPESGGVILGEATANAPSKSASGGIKTPASRPGVDMKSVTNFVDLMLQKSQIPGTKPQVDPSSQSQPRDAGQSETQRLHLAAHEPGGHVKSADGTPRSPKMLQSQGHDSSMGNVIAEQINALLQATTAEGGAADPEASPSDMASSSGLRNVQKLCASGKDEDQEASKATKMETPAVTAPANNCMNGLKVYEDDSSDDLDEN